MKTENTSIEKQGNAVLRIVSRSKMVKNFYCRRRNCIHHHGFKEDNVRCDLLKPEIYTDKDGRTCCNSYCG